MEYIRKNNENLNFPEGYTQLFQYKSSNNATMEREIVNKKMAGEFTDSDVRLCAFLFEHKVATMQMLASIINVPKEEYEEFEVKLSKLTVMRVMNRFALVDDQTTKEIPKDALLMYTLDFGGKYLLDHFWKSTIDSWNSGAAGLCSEKVSRSLMNGLLHLKLIESCPSRLKEYRCRNYRMGREVYNISSEFRLEYYNNNHELTKKYFLADVVRKYDFEVELRDRLECINSLTSTKLFMRFWPLTEAPPIVLFVVEDSEMVISLCQFLQGYKIPKYFITTDAQLQFGLNRPSGVWVTWDPDIMNLKEVKTKMFLDQN